MTYRLALVKYDCIKSWSLKQKKGAYRPFIFSYKLQNITIS